MSIHYPSTSSIQAKHKILLVTLGGASGSTSSGGKLVSSLADCFTTPGSPNYDQRVLGVTGFPAAGTNWPSTIADKLYDLVIGMLSKSGVNPKIAFVGKSLGGCRLHAVSEIFSELPYCLGIDLFVGIDMSCWPAKHYQKYVSDPVAHEKEAKKFLLNINTLLNFYETNDSSQTGHPALWVGAGPDIDDRFNVNVNTQFVAVDSSGQLVPSATPIDPTVDHMTIDESVPLVEGLKRIISATML
jgi:hypothetical protein